MIFIYNFVEFSRNACNVVSETRRNLDVRSICKEKNVFKRSVTEWNWYVSRSVTFLFVLNDRPYLCVVMLMVAMAKRWTMSETNHCDRNSIRLMFARNLNRWLLDTVVSTMRHQLSLSTGLIHRYMRSNDFFVSAINCAVWWHSTECSWVAMWAVNLQHYSKMKNGSMHRVNVSISVEIHICFVSAAPCDSNHFCLFAPNVDFARSILKLHCSADMPYSMTSYCRLFSPCHRWMMHEWMST